MDPGAQLRARRDTLRSRAEEIALENLQLRQQTQRLYEMSLQYQHEIDINQSINQSLNTPNIQNQQIDQLIIQKQQLMAQLRQNQSEHNQILSKVNYLKGTERNLLFVDNHNSQLEYDNSKLFFNNNIYEFDQIIDETIQFVPPSSTELVIYSKNVNKNMVNRIITQIFDLFEFQEANFQLYGVDLKNNTDIFDSENKLSVFNKFNNLIKIPVRNFGHVNQILGQIDLSDDMVLLVDVEYTPQNEELKRVHYYITILHASDNHEAITGSCAIYEQLPTGMFKLNIWDVSFLNGLQIGDVLQRYQEVSAGMAKTGRVAIDKTHE